MISKSFCILPWIHFYANADGSVLPCCIGDHQIPLGNVQNNTIQEVWNSHQYKTMRLNMLAGQRCQECKSCYQAEDAGVNSFRQTVNRDYAEFLNLAAETNSDGSLDSMQLKYLDIRWSNICNFKCRSCSSTYSSSWATEDNKSGQNKKVFIFAGGDNNDMLHDQLKPYISQVREIYFAGGEPLLMDKHYEILNDLIASDNVNIKIRYNSNLSSLTFKDTSVINLWKRFSNVHLNISLDSWNERAEYIREGTDWNKIVENIRLVRAECPHVHIGIASVISVFNICTLTEFIDYMIENKLIDSSTPVSFYSLLNPNYYSFDIFDQKIKNTILENLRNTTFNKNIKHQVENIIKHINSSVFDIELQKKFKVHTDRYDTIRNKKFTETFPELKEFYENIF